MGRAFARLFLQNGGHAQSARPVRIRCSETEAQTRIAAIARFAQMARAMEVPKLTAVATAAVRNAEDGEEFCLDVLNQTSQHITIVNGEEEALPLCPWRVVGLARSYGLVCDIGTLQWSLRKFR